MNYEFRIGDYTIMISSDESSGTLFLLRDFEIVAESPLGIIGTQWFVYAILHATNEKDGVMRYAKFPWDAFK